MDKNKKIEEAVNRMQALHFSAELISDFQDGQVYCSEYGKVTPVMNEFLNEIRKFEKKWDAVIYHVIRTQTDFGMIFSFLYVSAHPEEWADDFHELEAGYPFIYSKNETYPERSDFGTICVMRFGDGLIRVN